VAALLIHGMLLVSTHHNLNTGTSRQAGRNTAVGTGSSLGHPVAGTILAPAVHHEPAYCS
jgi:hypothetical protein